MAQPITIHSAYSGMAQDFARDEMPAGAVWNLVDYFPNILGAPLRKRGGSVYATSAVTAATSLRRVMYGLTDSGAAQLLAIDSATSGSAGQTLWSFNETTGAVTQIGSLTAASAGTATTNVVAGDPVAHGKRWYIPLGWSVSGATAASTAPTCWDGKTLSKVDTKAASGGVNGYRYLAVYKSRLVAASGPMAPRRLYFSDPGVTDQNRFNTKQAWLDVPMQVSGLCPLANVLVVYGYDRTVRIRGSIPPPESDFVVDDLTDEGCFDGRSIAQWSNRAVWANTNGIFMTDGITVSDLTGLAGMSNYYRQLINGMTSAWTLRGTEYRGYYFLTITNASGAFVDCLVCDLRARSFFRVSNFNWEDYCVGTGIGTQQLFAVSKASQRITRLTDIFLPSGLNSADADGTAVLPTVEYPSRRGWTRFQRRWVQTQGLSHWRNMYLTYLLENQDNQSYAAAVQADSPLTWYRMQATSATTEADQGSLALTAGYHGSPTLNQPGPLPGSSAVAFASSASQSLSGQDNNGYSILSTSAMSVELWARCSASVASSTTSFQVLISKFDSTGNNTEWVMERGQTGTHRFRVVDSSVNIIADVSFGTPSLNTWHHHVATISSAGGVGTVTTYLDGAAVNTATFALSAISNTTSALVVGARDAAFYVDDTQISEVAIYSTALSSARVLAHYAGSTAPSFQLSYVTTPDQEVYTTLADTLPDTTTQARGRFDFGPVGERGGITAPAVGFKVQQVNASTDTRVYSLGAEMDAIEGSRLEQ